MTKKKDTTPNTAATRAAREYSLITQTLQVALIAYRDTYGLTNNELARELNTGPTQISKYLNNKADFAVEVLEATIADVLRHSEQRRVDKDALFETSVSRQVNAVCETIRKTDDVGLIHSPAGVGKTCGMALYRIANPSAIAVTLTKWCGSSRALERAIFEQLDTRTFRRNRMRRGQWLERRLNNSKRLVMLDNAQRLTASGLAWVFDFHDATNVPFALIGNPEVLQHIRRCDQHYSRVGLQTDLKMTDYAGVTDKMLAHYLPENGDQVRDLALRVCKHKGHVRALRKHLQLVRELTDGAKKADYHDAFLTAHTMLVSDYRL